MSARLCAYCGHVLAPILTGPTHLLCRSYDALCHCHDCKTRRAAQERRKVSPDRVSAADSIPGL